MVYCVRRRILVGKNLTNAEVIHKWDKNHVFAWNIGDPKSWRHWLKKVRKDGKPLPRRTPKGLPIIYDVYIWGSLKGTSGRNGGGRTPLYPGRDSKGIERDVKKYGRLDIPIPIFDGEKKEYTGL